MCTKHCYFFNSRTTEQKLNQKGKATSIYPDELVSVVGKRQGITKEDPVRPVPLCRTTRCLPCTTEQSFGMLSESVFRVLHTYEMVDTVYARSKTPYALGSKDDNALKELFTLLRPDDTLNDLISKQWQDVSQMLASRLDEQVLTKCFECL